MQFPPSNAPAGSASAAWVRVVRLAAAALRTPAAVLVGVDGRQVLAAHGVGPEAAAGGAAFYGRALEAAGSPLAVADEALVAGAPEFRAGLAVAAGNAGVLCVLDAAEREFTAAEADTLLDLAALAQGELPMASSPATTGHEGNEDPYRSIFENAVEGIYQSLPGGGFLSVNPALATLLGYGSPEAMLAAVDDPARLYVRSGRRDEFEARLRADGVLADWESEVYRADGTCLWISEHACAIRDADGTAVVRYEGTFEDISARKEAEAALQRTRDELEDRVRERTSELVLLNGTLRQHIEERDIAEAALRRSESKFRALIENAQDITSVLTPDGISLYQSPSVEHLLGHSPDELIGRNIFQEFIHPDDLPAVERAALAITEGGERYARVEVRCRHRDGSWRLLESVGSSTPSDSPVVGLIVNSRDITGRRRVELEHQARTREQTAVAELGRYALEASSLQDTFEQTVTLVALTLQIPYCHLSELLPGGAGMLVRAAVGWREGTAGCARVPDWRHDLPGRSGLGTAKELLIIDDLAATDYQPEGLQPAQGYPEPRSALSVVVQCDGQRFGSLCVFSPRPGRFDRRDALFLQTVADLLSAVIESERHKAASREVQARYERIAAYTPGMVYQAIRHTDGTGRVLFVSEGCRQLYGLEPAQIMAQPELMNEMIHPEDRVRTKPLLAESNANVTPLQWEGRLVRPDGEVRWVTARSRPERLPNGDIYRDGLVFDVTALKHAQEEAEKANRAKSEFLSRISHELRTPLNAILGFGQLLGLEQLTPVQASSVDQILKGGRHLLDLINEVLDITRIESGGMELSLAPVDVADVLREAISFVRPLAEQYRVRFTMPAEFTCCPAVVADRGRLNQVLLNLLSNAVKYNREGGEVGVVCEPGEAEGTVRLSIRDTGLGLTAEELGQLFTPFQRLGAAGRGIAGTGIGLTISRSLVEAMHGRIGAESTPGVGSVFHVDLPAAPAGAQVPAAPDLDAGLPEPPAEAIRPTVRQVLLVDDQSANVALIERVLEARDNLRLLTAADGLGGLAIARQHPLDLILLDLHLPDIGGDEVMRRLRGEPRTRDIPVVVLSADATRTQIDRLKALGARDYLTKPFRIRELLGAVDAALAAPAAASP